MIYEVANISVNLLEYFVTFVFTGNNCMTTLSEKNTDDVIVMNLTIYYLTHIDHVPYMYS